MERTELHYTMATPRKAKKTPLNLDTAIQADGALKPLRSVYELIGLKNVSYREKTYAAYQEQLRRMDLAQLHEHSYQVGVAGGATKEIAIDRLERKYLTENPEQRDQMIAERNAALRDEGELTVSEQATRIRSKGR